jgi:hypothetical protein
VTRVTVVLLVVLSGCKVAGNPRVAEQHLGPGTICNRISNSAELACITESGMRFICATLDEKVNCARSNLNAEMSK